MLDNSRRQVDKEARPLLQTDFLSGPTDVTTVKVAEKSSIEQRKSVEQAHMERPDLQLAKRMQTKTQTASYPFFAKSRKEWDKDLCLPTEMQRRTDRAKASALKQQKPRIPLPEPVHDVVSDDSSDSSSTSSGSSSRSAKSTTSSSSERDPATVEEPEAVGDSNNNTDTPWVSPDGRLVHFRVDLPTGMYSKLCQPLKEHKFSNNTLKGDAETPADIRWCPECLRIMA